MTDSDTPETIPTPAPEPAAAAVTETAVAAPPRHVDARNPVWTVGRRKSASARVRMFPGGGNFMVNGKPLDDHLRLVQDRNMATSPLDVTGTRKRFDVWVNATGGGTTGQAGAIALGVARALVVLAPDTEPALREAGLMSRDARAKERKKYGRRGARRGFQFSKR